MPGRDERFGRFVPPTDDELAQRRSPEAQEERQKILNSAPFQKPKTLSTIVFVDGMPVRIPQPPKIELPQDKPIPAAGNLFKDLTVQVGTDAAEPTKLLQPGEVIKLLPSGLKKESAPRTQSEA